MKTSNVKLHLNHKSAIAYICTFVVIVLLLTIVVVISTVADLAQIDSFLQSNYVYSATAPSTTADDAYIRYNAGISFSISADGKAGINADVVMQTADAQYTDLVNWNAMRLKKDGIAISRNIAESNGIEIGDILYSKNIIDGEIHKYVIEAILPAVTYTKGTKEAFHTDGVIVMGYDDQYASNITHKCIIFASKPIEDLALQCSTMPVDIVYRDDEIASVFSNIVPYIAVYLLAVAISMIVFVVFLVKNISHNFRRLIMFGFKRAVLNKAYYYTIGKATLLAIIVTAIFAIVSFAGKDVCSATITPVVCMVTVELISAFGTMTILNRQLWRE